MFQHSNAPTAAARWRELLAARQIPAQIRQAAPQDPHRHDPARFLPPGVPDDTPSRRAALELLGPDGGTVLDVGCGGGAAGLALVPSARHLTGVDHAEDMLRVFAQACTERGVAHRCVLGPWPDYAPAAGVADVVVSHHVGYNTVELAPFIAALAAATRRGVVVELHAEHPGGWLDPLWTRFHRLHRPPPATVDDALAVFAEIGVHPDVQRWTRPPTPRNPGAEVDFALRRLCLPVERRAEVAEAVQVLGPRHRDLVTISWSG
ncbi:MAG: methyltransferase domain-containing protein [Pseudonocardiaceae bacterium]